MDSEPNHLKELRRKILVHAFDVDVAFSPAEITWMLKHHDETQIMYAQQYVFIAIGRQNDNENALDISRYWSRCRKCITNIKNIDTKKQFVENLLSMDPKFFPDDIHTFLCSIINDPENYRQRGR